MAEIDSQMAMKAEFALWHILHFIPINTRYSLEPLPRGVGNLPSIQSVLSAKRNNSLKKAISNEDLCALLVAIEALKFTVNENGGITESFCSTIFETKMMSFANMSIVADRMKIKRQRFKTIVIKDYGSIPSLDVQQHQIFPESQCRSIIRQAKKRYRNEKAAVLTHTSNSSCKRQRTSKHDEYAYPQADLVIMEVGGDQGDQEDEQEVVADDIASFQEATIAQSEHLDFDQTPRLCLGDGKTHIKITTRTHPTSQQKLNIAACAVILGYHPNLPLRRKSVIINTAKRRIYFQSGLPQPGNNIRYIEPIVKEYYNAILIGREPWDALAQRLGPSTHERQSRVQKVMKEHPTLLHTAYRYSIKTVGMKASFPVITNVMNKKIKSIGSSITLTIHNVREFFYQHSGKLKREKFVPRLTDEKKLERVDWCEWMLLKIAILGALFNICFLDEKWFYICSRRRFEKHLPKANFESEEDAAPPPMPSTRSRRFMPKVMFMGVVAPPATKLLAWMGQKVPGWRNGKIMLLRISKKKKLKKKSYNQKFVSDGQLNRLIKDGDWRTLYSSYRNDEDVTVGEFMDMIALHYGIGNEVCARLCVLYQTLARVKMKTIELSYEKNYNEPLVHDRVKKTLRGNTRPLTIDDLKLTVLYKKDDEVEVDCSCDSNFMLSKMREVGQAIRKYFFWVRRDQPIYLVIDNAGGHGTNEAIAEYKTFLKDEFNIILKHQVPNSPETNILDLGLWMAIQAYTERLSYRERQDVNVLADAVRRAWDQLPISTIGKVYKRWLLVLKIIKFDNGGNEKVESFRGKLTSDPAHSNDIDDERDKIEQELLAEAMDSARTRDRLHQAEDITNEESDEEIDLTGDDSFSDDEVHLNLNDLHDDDFL